MKASLLAEIKETIVNYRFRFLGAFVMVLISNCLLICNPLILRQALFALDPFLGSPTTLTHTLQNLLGDWYYALVTWVVLLLLTSLLAALFKFYMRIVFIGISRDVEQELRSKIFYRLQEQSRAFFDRHSIGELMSRLTNDLAAFRDMLGPGIMYPVYFATLVIPAIIVLFTISPRLATLSLVPVISLPLLILLIQKFIYRTTLKVQEGLADMSNMAQEHYSAVKIVKSYEMEQQSLKRFKALCKNLQSLNLRLYSLQGMFYPLITLITRSTTVFLVLLAGYIILLGWDTLSTADFLSFMWVQSFIYSPVLMLGWMLPVYQKGHAAYDRLVEVYHEKVEVKDNVSSELLVPPKADIVIRNLEFNYPLAENAALSIQDLKIQGGTFVGITGPIGSGKTTLFKLLNREYEVPQGSVRVGDRDIQEYSLENLSKAMAIVEQIPFLFSTTIAENVKFGSFSTPQEDLEMASQLADLHETVMAFPDRYETVVGERGITLSGGQKQRLAMARAFLGNKSILLLDDIFSAVDAKTEKRIFHQIREKFSGKTVILITQRVSVLESMERILFMIDGRIVEDGSPPQLMQQQGHFSALAELQRLGKT